MANHVIRDRVWASRKLAQCSMKAALAYPWIFLVCDDWGRFEFRPRVIWGMVFGAREDVSLQDVQGWLSEYERVGLLVRYHMDGDLAYWTGFEGRAKSKRRPSMYPDPEQFHCTADKPDESVRTFAGGPSEQVSTPLPPAEQSRAEQIGAETETERSNTARSVSTPTDEERTAYAEAVWSEFLRASGERETRPITPREYEVLDGWIKDGIPLPVVIRGITDTRNKGRMLGYYNSSVRTAYEYWRQAVPA